MASSYEIKSGRLIFRNNGEKYIDDDEKKHISGSFTEIEFPPCFDQLYDDDFKACRNQLSKVTKLDFSKATKIETIGDDTFTGASSLKVVVLPKKVTAINEFRECPNLEEIHIYKLEDLYCITKDKDKRLTVYASQVSSDITSLDDGFLSDVGILYVPANKVRKMEKARDDYDDELDIRPLPDGYSFPTEALSEPWLLGWTPAQSEEETKFCPNCGERHSINIDVCPCCGYSVSGGCEVVLVSTGPAKLQLVKAIKEVCDYGLKEAKDIVDSAPSSVIRNVSIERAEEIKREIENVGGKARINGGEKTATKEANSSTTSVKTASAEALATQTSSVPQAITLEDVYGGPQYYCVLEGKSFGPVTIRQFANMARFGIVDKNTMVWKNGMSNWALAQTVADLQVVV